MASGTASSNAAVKPAAATLGKNTEHGGKHHVGQRDDEEAEPGTGHDQARRELPGAHACRGVMRGDQHARTSPPPSSSGRRSPGSCGSAVMKAPALDDSERGDGRRQREGNVHEEDRAPAQDEDVRAGEDAAEEQARGYGHAAHGTVDAESGAAFLAGERFARAAVIITMAAAQRLGYAGAVVAGVLVSVVMT